jgi:hypothetical protein
MKLFLKFKYPWLYYFHPSPPSTPLPKTQNRETVEREIKWMFCMNR